MSTIVSRRHFVGGCAAALGCFGAAPQTAYAQSPSTAAAAVRQPRPRLTVEDYDAAAKLAYNENPYGPPDSVVRAMTDAFKYDNRYSYPDGNIHQEIASHHGVAPANILLGAGSSEILQVAGRTFLQGGRKAIGFAPTFGTVYEYASGIRTESIILPLGQDYRQDVAALAKAARRNYRDVGLVYLCTPNNPTGLVVTAREIRELLDAVPEDVPVLIDEAYHHYVEHAGYASSVPFVIEGRQVVIARTFSKIYGLAGMRLGYAIAPAPLIQRMEPHTSGSINALVKWAGVAALRDTASAERVRATTLQLRKKTTTELESLGYPVIPSDANFFMVHLRRPVAPVIDDLRTRGVLVGRPFPPMLEHLRVSVGTEDEMGRFGSAFKEVMTRGKSLIPVP